MTAKQKVMLVAAQYAQIARKMTKQADAIDSLARQADEEEAAEILEDLEAEGLVDSDGMLTLSTDGESGAGSTRANASGSSKN